MNAYNLHIKSDGSHTSITAVGMLGNMPYKSKFTMNAGRNPNSWEMRDHSGGVITTMRGVPKMRAIERALAWLRKLEQPAPLVPVIPTQI